MVRLALVVTFDVVAGPRPCAPPRWRTGDGTAMGDPRRFEVFARFLRRTFPAAATVADIAGGHGELAFWLGELGLRPTIVDPRPTCGGADLDSGSGGPLVGVVQAPEHRPRPDRPHRGAICR
jgi:hypothetical protein